MHDVFDTGMLHQGIFRVSGSVNEMTNYKAMFERGLSAYTFVSPFAYILDLCAFVYGLTKKSHQT